MTDLTLLYELFLILVKRNITEAIKIADHLIKAHIKNAIGMEELVKDWTTENKGLGLEIASVHRDVATCIGMIKDLLEQKQKPKENIVKVIA